MVKHQPVKRILGCTALVLALLCSFAFNVFAEAAPCESATAAGHYRHPVSGTIEDSGGESSEALGQSMVDSVVGPEALLETASDGSMYLSMRFNLMSNISDTHISVQSPGDSDWTDVTPVRTAEGEDSADLRIPVPGKDVIVRAQCFVDAMGRAVVFYVTVDNFTAGNNYDFAQIDADYKPGDSAPAGTVVPAGGDDVVGLVTGGSGTAAKPAAPAEQSNGQSSSAVSGEIIISGRVWVVFFVLVFCAQLLACLAFWGLKALIDHVAGRRAAVVEEEEESAFLPDEDEDFSTDFMDSEWTEDDDENP